MKSFVSKHYYTLLIVPYVVGAIGFAIPDSRDFFLTLTPVMLWFSFALVIVEEWEVVSKKLGILLSIGVIAMFAEFLGANYGYFFGEYSYGNALGILFGGVPVLIGINWIMLMVASRSFSSRFTNNTVFQIVLAALLVTLFDVLLEPVAIHFEWWTWEGEVPLRNYIAWFVLAGALQSIFSYTPVKMKRSYTMIFAQAIFFTILLLL